MMHLPLLLLTLFTLSFASASADQRSISPLGEPTSVGATEARNMAAIVDWAARFASIATAGVFTVREVEERSASRGQWVS